MLIVLLDSYFRKRGTRRKRTTSNGCDTFRDDDGSQRRTRLKRIISNCRDTVRDGDGGQRRAFKKRIFFNCCDAIRVVIDAKEEQEENALFPIFVIPFSMLIFFNRLSVYF